MERLVTFIWRIVICVYIVYIGTCRMRTYMAICNHRLIYNANGLWSISKNRWNSRFGDQCRELPQNSPKCLALTDTNYTLFLCNTVALTASLLVYFMVTKGLDIRYSSDSAVVLCILLWLLYSLHAI